MVQGRLLLIKVNIQSVTDAHQRYKLCCSIFCNTHVRKGGDPGDEVIFIPLALPFILQGSYLGCLLSNTNGEITKQNTEELEKEKIKPFSYRHLGSFAYVGDNKAVLQLPLIGKLCVPTQQCANK